MKERNDLVYLKHILDSISWIENYISEIKYQDFMNNHLVQDGIVRQVEIVGEATKNLSQKIKNKYSEVPWKDIAGMRDKLIHGYFGVDLDAVWDTAKKDIPKLKIQIKKIIEREKKK